MVMTYERGDSNVCTLKIGAERRQYRRVDLEHRGVMVERFEGNGRIGTAIGQLVDLSAGGVRIRTDETAIKPDTQIRVRVSLPQHAGIAPFIDTTGPNLAPKSDWVGWMSVARVIRQADGTVEIAGPLMDMDEMDRGMLGLYLSTQPIAA